MKTPDEIKKGLELCLNDCRSNCPYEDDCFPGNPFAYDVPKAMMMDAIALIQQLEKRIIHLEALNQQNLSVITMQERTRVRLEERISQLEPIKALVSQYILEQHITCSEDIWQRDKPQEEAIMLVYKLCKLVGYMEVTDG